MIRFITKLNLCNNFHEHLIFTRQIEAGIRFIYNTVVTKGLPRTITDHGPRLDVCYKKVIGNIWPTYERYCCQV